MAGIDDFIFDSSKDVCPGMDRTDAGLITQKQIRYIYVLIKQYDLDKAEVEATGFRHMTSQEASNLIDSIQNGTFGIEQKEDTSLEALLNSISDDDIPF